MALRSAGMIEVTGCDLATLVRAAYAPSRQQGLGAFDSNGRGGISEKDVLDIIERGKEDPMCAVSMDYWNGRSIKMRVMKDGERLFIRNQWYDHGDGALGDLLEQIGLSRDRIAEARKAEADYRDSSKAAAIAFLREKGGVYRQDRGYRANPNPEDVIPLKIEDGLWSAVVDNLVTEESVDGITVWRSCLVQKS